jgi:outer membrane protein OmpA-like peptidoglycan-associated protein
LDKETPLDLHEARNAVRIARWAGADKDAGESFQKANQLLQQAEAYKARKAGNKPVSMTAREAVQTAEDARLIALKRQDEQRIDQERQAAAEREAQAKAEAERSRLQAEADARQRLQAENEQRLEAERGARAEAERAAAEAQARTSQAQAEAAKERALKDQAAAERAEQEKTALRSALVQQLNRILETRETARGLVVNISDVLFDSGQYTLKPAAREKLAKVSGIVLAHPGLRLEVEGHTDSVGSDEFNQQLSEKRAATVRDFLVQEGIALNAVTARGFGKTMPVASNDTADGRQRNRRVEMIVAGDVIGIPIGPTSGPTGR